MANEKSGSSRRDFLLKTITLVPAVAIGGTGIGSLAAPMVAHAAEPKTPENIRHVITLLPFLLLKNMRLCKRPLHA